MPDLIESIAAYHEHSAEIHRLITERREINRGFEERTNQHRRWRRPHRNRIADALARAGWPPMLRYGRFLLIVSHDEIDGPNFKSVDLGEIPSLEDAAALDTQAHHSSDAA